MESEEIEFAVTPGLRSLNSMNDSDEETQIQPISDDDWDKIPLLAKNKQFVDWIGQESVLNETPNFKKVKSTETDQNHIHTLTLSQLLTRKEKSLLRKQSGNIKSFIEGVKAPNNSR